MEFNVGPFVFRDAGARRVNQHHCTIWRLHYGEQLLAERTLPAECNPHDVCALFADDTGAFTAEMRSRHGGRVVWLRDALSGQDVASFVAPDGWVPGMSAGLTDDRWQYWLVSSRRPTQSLPLESLADFGRLVREHEMPANGWIAGLLPEHVLSANPDEWQPPTSWELRHVVGESSFTGVTGAAAAALVGVTPQNFRKYLAPEGAATRQRISYAMWHLLLHRLGVQQVRA